jgi:hypothetical protein
MKKLYIKECDDELQNGGLDITVIDDNSKETVRILKEAFSTKLSDWCEIEVRFVKQFWPLEYYLEDREYYNIDPIPFSEALVYLDGNSLVIEDDGNFLHGYEGKTKTSIDISKLNLLQIIVGYDDYFYRGFEILFKRIGANPLEAERYAKRDVYSILEGDERWIKSLKLDFENRRPKPIFDKYEKDGYIELKLGDFIIKGEMKNFPLFDMKFGYLKDVIYYILGVEINEHVRFYVCCDASFTINDTIKFTVEKIHHKN